MRGRCEDVCGGGKGVLRFAGAGGWTGAVPSSSGASEEYRNGREGGRDANEAASRTSQRPSGPFAAAGKEGSDHELGGGEGVIIFVLGGISGSVSSRDGEMKIFRALSWRVSASGPKGRLWQGCGVWGVFCVERGGHFLAGSPGSASCQRETKG